MKSICSVVQDLLPLYIDHVCQEETAAFVEGHLKECDACREKEQTYRQQLPAQSLPKPKISFARLASTLRKKQVWISVISVICALLLYMLGTFVYRYLRWEPNARVPVDQIVFSDFQTLSDGRIIFNARVTDGYQVTYFEAHENTFWLARPYLTSLEESSQPGGNPDDRPPFSNTYWAIHPGEDGTIIYDDGNTQTVIWETGDPAPAASEDMEEKFVH
ncbi:MAG TPA: zf-HC2 domain-containing protein [Firmicutes bacterium]|nr:zf-HC2 domain-containing protein [Bacillota bacterium]